MSSKGDFCVHGCPFVSCDVVWPNLSSCWCLCSLVHFFNTNIHFLHANIHFFNTNIHFFNTNTHFFNTNTHFLPVLEPYHVLPSPWPRTNAGTLDVDGVRIGVLVRCVVRKWRGEWRLLEGEKEWVKRKERMSERKRKEGKRKNCSAPSCMGLRHGLDFGICPNARLRWMHFFPSSPPELPHWLTWYFTAIRERSLFLTFSSVDSLWLKIFLMCSLLPHHPSSLQLISSATKIFQGKFSLSDITKFWYNFCRSSSYEVSSHQ